MGLFNRLRVHMEHEGGNPGAVYQTKSIEPNTCETHVIEADGRLCLVQESEVWDYEELPKAEREKAAYPKPRHHPHAIGAICFYGEDGEWVAFVEHGYVTKIVQLRGDDDYYFGS